MKRLIILLAATGCITFANAQKISSKNIPASVKTSFQKQFPDVKNVHWEKEKANYEAGFKMKETDYSVLINPSGDIIETETGIGINELSPSVKEYVAKHYPGQQIKEAAKITDAKGTITYEAAIKGKDLIFDPSGKFIREQKD